ncbi:MAG: FtsW/RodA/SpoVE family cell cycle protein [Butyrivibrio sp.]|nr:FtsW/RodA/SpoVE family cell cycle protein [Butyrivibrio sp.]
MFKNFHFKLKYVNIRMILLVMALTILGIVVIGSAVPGAGFQKKQIIGAGAGFIIMMVMMLVDYNWILKFHWAIYALCILMLGAVLVLGKNVKGATRWIAVSDGISIQPSEFAKILLVLFWAWLFGKNQDFIKKWKFFFIGLALTLVPVLLIVKEPDLSTTLLVMGVFVTVLFVGGFSYKKFGIILAVVVPVLAGVIIYVQAVPPPKNLILHEYQYNRVMAFLDPENYDDARLQQDNSVMAIGSGKLNGKGLYNNSAQSVKNGNFIPEPQTDFIFAIVGEEMGFVGSCLVLGLIFLIVVESVITGARAPDMSGRIICFGFAAIMTLQTFINIGVATELLPNTGIPLPFVSYGLSSLTAMFAGVGLVLNVRFRKKALLEEENHEHRFDRA